MTPDGFLSVLSIAIAVYALMTPVQRMKARLSLHLQSVLAVIAIGLVVYLELFAIVQRPCVLTPWACQALVIAPPQTLSAQQIAFLVVLTWLLLAVAIHQFTRPSAAALTNLGKIVDTLLMERKHDDLIMFLTPHMKLLKIGAERRFIFQSLHDWLAGFAPVDPQDLFRVPTAPGKDKLLRRWLPNRVKSSIAWLAHLVPSERGYQAAATDILVRVARSDPVRNAITTNRPYFAFYIFNVDFYEKFEFSNAYFRALIADRNSVFYQELEVGLSTSWTEGFNLEPFNHLQNYLFANCAVADDLSVYKPIGDYVEELIGGQHALDYVEKLNGLKTNPAIERDPTLKAIVFFDIMVRRAAFQGLNRHMWLMYLTHFVERVEAVSELPQTSEDEWLEFPTFGTYVIYEAFDTLGGWVHLVRDLPEGSPHLRLNNREHVSIPVFAAEALGRSLKIVLRSSRLTDEFKSYMLEAVMYDIKNLHSQEVQGEARKMLIARIVGGGEPGHDADHLARLDRYLGTVDYMLKSDVSDFVEAVRAPST